MSGDSTFLDVEDDEQRQKRIGSLLERLNTTSSSSSVSANPLPNIDHEYPPGLIEPPAELLARVQAFLPAISASNEVLSHKKPEDINIENIPEDAEEYIEMNLGLGVFEAKRRPEPGSRSPPPFDSDSTSDATSSELDTDSDSSSSSPEEDSDSDSDSSSSDDLDTDSRSESSVDTQPIPSRPIKPLPRRVSQRAKLEV